MTVSGKLYDVAIVGYGPVGATLANLLARQGLNMAVIEQAADVYDKPRAITLVPGLRADGADRYRHRGASRHALSRRRW
jgi:2-polyprenyl-6-methoxyphenol hydroxylase-like FAD-dependent oxidoreductase